MPEATVAPMPIKKSPTPIIPVKRDDAQTSASILPKDTKSFNDYFQSARKTKKENFLKTSKIPKNFLLQYAKRAFDLDDSLLQEKNGEKSVKRLTASLNSSRTAMQGKSKGMQDSSESDLASLIHSASKDMAEEASVAIHGNKAEQKILTAEKKEGASAAKDLEKPIGNLSSLTQRVEVVDKRKLMESIEHSNTMKVVSSRKQSSLVTADKPQSTDAMDAKFIIAETEVHLSKTESLEPSNKSVADALARRLDGQAGNEIVRQVKIILNQATSGEIRMNIHPDNLGRVRVRIQLEDNQLTGRIFVESAAARDAFRSSLDGLQAKLVESGFGAADLELTWDGQGMNDSQEHTKQQANFEKDVNFREHTVEDLTVFNSAVHINTHVNMMV